MKFALVEGQRREAQPDLSGKCPGCGSTTIAKCGEKKIWHWAHKGKRNCDHWWENETEWHRDWKSQFPESWQEVVHRADSGEKHIADVTTPDGWVVEFQHSFIKPEEQRSRNAFYGKLVWVVDATRRKRDMRQVLSAWEEGTPLGKDPFFRRAPADASVLFREWPVRPAPTFLDLGRDHPLLLFHAAASGTAAYIAPVQRNYFTETLRDRVGENPPAFDAFLQAVGEHVARGESLLRARASLPLPHFQRYLAAKDKRRRRF